MNESVCNSKQKWNCDECCCECKELDDWRYCEKDYLWNLGTCIWECDIACKIDKHLDTKNCFSKKWLICKLVLECEDKMLNTTETSWNMISHDSQTYSHDFISYSLLIISHCYCWLLLLLLHTKLDQQKIDNILILNE